MLDKRKLKEKLKNLNTKILAGKIGMGLKFVVRRSLG
jgi:hypothetical protein